MERIGDPQDTKHSCILRHTLAEMAPVARSIVAKFTAMNNDIPIKMSSITKLERDGSNFRHWEVDFLSYIGFIPDVAVYVNGEKQTSDKDYKQDFADIVNCIIHWTINRELSLSMQDIASPFERIEEMRKQFSGISFAGRQSGWKELYTAVYDLKSTTLDQHIMMMRGKRDRLAAIGVRLQDDIFGLILSNSMPSGFPDIAPSFENRLLLDESHVVTSSDITRALGAADVGHRRSTVDSEVLKVSAKPRWTGGGGETRTCFWCDIKGHTVRECRKKKEHDRLKSSGPSQAKNISKTVKAAEV